jgi:putative ATP-dependent endonuclease of OLD family
MAENEGVLTLRDFLDEKASPIPLDNIDDLARHLIRLTPVLRLRDARFMRRIRNGTVPNMPEVEVTARELDFLARELVSRPQNLTDGQIRQGCPQWYSCWSTIFPSRERRSRAIA